MVVWNPGGRCCCRIGAVAGTKTCTNKPQMARFSPTILRSVLRPTTVVLLLIALAWVMTTAAGGRFRRPKLGTGIRTDLFFLTLAAATGPPSPPPNLRAYLGAPLLLRHYLGYFMVPGLIGNWFGPAALNWAVPLWTWCGVAPRNVHVHTRPSRMEIVCRSRDSRILRRYGHCAHFALSMGGAGSTSTLIFKAGP